MEIAVESKKDRKEYQREYYRNRYNTDPEFKQRHIENLKKSREKYKQLKNDINNI
jgi:hypothetical protein